MKNYIISMIAFVVIAFGTVSNAHAQVFNVPAEMPTMTITDHTTHPCYAGPIDGCWQTSTSAQPGDIIAVQIYYRNSTGVPAQSTVLRMNTRNAGATTAVSFSGTVASSTVRSAGGTTNLSISSAQTVTYMPGTARWYPTDTSGPRAVDENALFGNGFNIGTVNSGDQGVLVVNYQIGNSVVITNNCSVSLSASDTSIDDGDSSVLSWTSSDCTNLTLTDTGSVGSSGSKTVYPSSDRTYVLTGTGSNGSSDTDSLTIYVNQNNNNNTCSINDFYADDTSIERGDTTTLRWTTSGDVDSVTLSSLSGNRSEDGSASVSPFETTTYTLRAYCNNGDTKSDSVTISVNGASTNGSAPQVVTTVATPLSTSQARLNGLTIPNSNVTTYSWFEWGPTQSLGYYTNKQTLTSTASTYYNDVVSGLVAGTTYYYRAATQNQYGTVYGSIVPFQTSGAVQSTTTIVKYVPQVTSNAIVAKSAPSLLELRVESAYDHMCVGGSINYHITFHNVSTQTLQNAVLRITLPNEIDYSGSSQGSYNVLDRTVTIPLGNMPVGASGTVDVNGKVNNSAVVGKVAVTTATVVYTNPLTRAQEDAIAYSIVTITNDCPNLLGASVFGFSFLPHTLLGWLLLIVVILALIVLARQFFKQRPTA